MAERAKSKRKKKKGRLTTAVELDALRRRRERHATVAYGALCGGGVLRAVRRWSSATAAATVRLELCGGDGLYALEVERQRGGDVNARRGEIYPLPPI